MIEAPKSKYQWLKTTGIYASAAVFTVGLGSVAGEIASRCQCHYTPVIFAEREGLRRVVLDVNIPKARREAFVARLETLKVFVDPTYSSGVSSVAAVFARADQVEDLKRIARTFATATNR